MVKNLPTNAEDMGSISESGRFHWKRTWQPTPVFLLGESHGQRSLVGYSPWCCKESDTTERLSNNSQILGTFPDTEIDSLKG